MPLTSSRGVPGRENSLRGSSSTVIQSGVSGRGRSLGAKGSIHLMTSSTATRASRHGISRGRCLTRRRRRTGVSTGMLPPPFHKFISIIAGFCSAVFYGFLTFCLRPRGICPVGRTKSPPAGAGGLVYGSAEGLVEGRLDLGQKADKGDGLQCVILRRKITHCIHRDGGRLRQRVAVHPGGDGGKGHRPAAVLHGQGQAAPVAGGQELHLSVAAPLPDGARGCESRILRAIYNPL